MPFWKQALLRRYHQDIAGDGTGGGGGGGDDAAAAALAAAAKATKDTADAAAAAAAALAAGTKKPTDEEAKLLKENMQRKQKIDDLTKEVAGFKDIQAALTELGGLDALKALVGDKKKNEETALEAKGDWERLKARMADEHTKAVKDLADKAAATVAELAKANSTIEELTIGQAFTGSKFLPETTYTPSKARIIYGAHFDTKDGKVVGYDKPRGAAERTELVDAVGKTLDFDAAMRMIVDADPEKLDILKAKTKSGAASGTAKAAAAARVNTDGMSGMDKINAGLKALNINLNP